VTIAHPERGTSSAFLPGPAWIGGHVQAARPYPSVGTRGYSKRLRKDQPMKGPAGAGVPCVTPGDLWTGCE